MNYFDDCVGDEGSAGRLRCCLNMHFGTVFGTVVDGDGVGSDTFFWDA